jgi:hypothetical protein
MGRVTHVTEDSFQCFKLLYPKSLYISLILSVKLPKNGGVRQIILWMQMYFICIFGKKVRN